MVLETARLSIIERFGLDAEEAGELPLNKSCFDPRRRQYLSPCLMDMLRSNFPAEEDAVLALMDEDIYARDLNFVFGQAELGGNYAIVSTFRLRETFYGASQENEELLKKRISTEVVHELGHVFGLEHCSSRKCVMFFSNSIADTDMKGDMFCDVCKAQLNEMGFHL